ncbi:14277_t:CDS:2, partial [Cetraspora pellucida]
VEITRLNELNREGTDREYALAKEITRLNRLNQEAILMLNYKFDENQKLLQDCKFLNGKMGYVLDLETKYPNVE